MNYLSGTDNTTELQVLRITIKEFQIFIFSWKSDENHPNYHRNVHS